MATPHRAARGSILALANLTRPRAWKFTGPVESCRGCRMCVQTKYSRSLNQDRRCVRTFRRIVEKTFGTACVGNELPPSKELERHAQITIEHEQNLGEALPHRLPPRCPYLGPDVVACRARQAPPGHHRIGRASC